MDIALEMPGAISQKINAHEWPRYVAVEGPIGVGKTTLARCLADALRYPLMLEPALENPFLDRFYRDRRRHALPTQLFFLLNRARLIADLPEDDLVGPLLVADFLMEKDRLFAEITLEPNELVLYQQIHDTLDLGPRSPDLVIYLQAPVDVLVRRIRHRGIEFEQNIEPDYLEALVSAYTEFFHFYDKAPLLVVNAAEIDFANNADHFEALLDQMIGMDGARHYFNPNPLLI
ncbi:MAG: deoxynucleoside kinase [Gammaproteobacteria bacterium]|nr:deoxynucleoside kinase [Gammaproteobacteria bacterium]